MKKIPKWGWRTIIGISLFSFVLVFGLYFYNFDNGLSGNQGTWGQFGDYFGGVLNPIFGFLGFIMLLYIIYLQQEQLDVARDDLIATRKELKLSRKEMTLTRETHEKNIEAIKQNTKKQLDLDLSIANEKEKTDMLIGTIKEMDLVINQILNEKIDNIFSYNTKMLIGYNLEYFLNSAINDKLSNIHEVRNTGPERIQFLKLLLTELVKNLRFLEIKINDLYKMNMRSTSIVGYYNDKIQKIEKSMEILIRKYSFLKELISKFYIEVNGSK